VVLSRLLPRNQLGSEPSEIRGVIAGYGQDRAILWSVRGESGQDRSSMLAYDNIR